MCKKELQTSASSIETDLCRGNYGCLDLTLSYDENATISNTHPFLAPIHPNLLHMPETVTVIEAFQIKDQHDEAKHFYLECKKNGKILLRHVNDAL